MEVEVDLSWINLATLGHLTLSWDFMGPTQWFLGCCKVWKRFEFNFTSFFFLHEFHLKNLTPFLGLI